MSDRKKTRPDRVERKLTEIGSSLADLLQSIRERRMTLRQIRGELDALRREQEARLTSTATPREEPAGSEAATESAHPDATSTTPDADGGGPSD
jgi:hypothetical protein